MNYLLIILSLCIGAFIVSCGDTTNIHQAPPDSAQPRPSRNDNHSTPQVINPLGYDVKEYTILPKILGTNIIASGNLKGLSVPTQGISIRKDDKRYQNIYTQYKKNIKSLNHVNLEKGARSIKIVGVDITLAHGEDIYDSLLEGVSENTKANDIAELEIHADTLTVADTLTLPGTQLTIYADKIIFKKNGKFILTPAAYPEVLENSPTRTPRETGRTGLDAPKLKVYANHVEIIGSDTWTTEKRFIARGGKGQRGGPGITGEPGEPITVPSDFFTNGRVVYSCTTKIAHKPAPGPGGGSIILNNPIIQDYTKCRGKKIIPNTGKDAIPGGLPGVPGQAAKFFTNNKKLMHLVDLEAGELGDIAPNAAGGPPGFPEYVVYQHLYEPSDLGIAPYYETHYGSRGQDAKGPTRSINDKDYVGESKLYSDSLLIEQINESYDIVLQYIEDLYQRNYYTEAYFTAQKFVEIISTEASPTFANDDKSILKAREIIAKIEVGKNFYGEDAFSIPFLSLSNALKIYNKQIETHLETLYFTNWIKTKNDNLITRRNQISNKINELNKEIKDDLKTNEDIIAKFEEIKEDALIIDRDTKGFLNHLEKLEREISEDAKAEIDRRERRANRSRRFKSILKTVAAIAKIIPVGQPMLATTVTSAEALIATFSSDSWPERLQKAASLYTNIQGLDFSNMASDWTQQLSHFRIDDLSNLSVIDKSRHLGDLGKLATPLVKTMENELRNLRSRRAPQSDLEKLIQEIKDTHPEFKMAMRLLSELNQKKTALDAKINESFIQLANIQSEILEKTTILAGLSQDGEVLLSTLPNETIHAINMLAHRAEYDLFKYLNYFSRVYYFRTLEQFPNDLDLKALNDEIMRLLKTTDENFALSDENLSQLKTLFLTPVKKVLSTFLNGSHESFINEQVTKINLTFTGDGLKLLSQGQTLYLNLKDAEIFNHGEQKNPRIKNIKISNIDIDLKDNVHNLTGGLYIKHAGYSIFEKKGEQYLFTHITPSGHNPFVWGQNINFNNLGAQYPINRNNSFESFLAALIGEHQNSKEEFVFPSATSDFEISLNLNKPELGKFVEIKNIELEVEYIFSL